MLEGACMTMGNRYRSTIFIDNGLIYSKWRVQNCFYFHVGALQKIIKMHWPTPSLAFFKMIFSTIQHILHQVMEFLKLF